MRYFISFITSILPTLALSAAVLDPDVTIASGSGQGAAPSGSGILRAAGGITNKVTSGTFANLFGDNVNPSLGAAGVGPWYPGTTVIGSANSDKVILGYLKSNSSRATIGGHNAALSSWAPISINGTQIDFRIGEQLIGGIDQNGSLIVGADPGGTEKVRILGAQRQTDYTVYGPNPNWGAYLIVGGNGHVDNLNASVVTTNGNLHLDAKAGFETYINFYAGNKTRIFRGNNIPHSDFNSDGSLTIGTDPQGTGLLRVGGGADIKGTVRTKEVIVTINGWADHVLAPEYTLPPLSSVAQAIEKDRHLPGIPSEEQLLKEGVSIGDMQRLQMAKIEELTLYAIQADKTNQELVQRVAALEKQLAQVLKALPQPTR